MIPDHAARQVKATSRRHWLALMLSVGALVLGACGDDEQGCKVTFSGNWPVNVLFSQNSPSRCPIKTPPGGRTQAYSALVSAPSGVTSAGDLEFYSYNSSLVTVNSQATRTPGQYSDAYVYYGSYTAGTIAPPGDTVAYDNALNSLYLTAGGTATAAVKLRYQNTAAAAVMGMSMVELGGSTILEGEYYQSDLVPPISYQWYKNASAISGATATQLEVFGENANSVDIYQFRATDSESRTVSASMTINTGSGCTPPQLEC